MHWKHYWMAFLAAIVAVGFWSGPSDADNLDLSEMAAALVLPVITGADGPNPLKPQTRGDVVIPGQTAATLATVTNGSSDGIILKVDVISGDVQPPLQPSDACQAQSFVCPLTGRETTTFVFTPWAGGRSRLDVECGHLVKDPSGNVISIEPTGNNVSKVLNAQNGIMFVSVGDPFTQDYPAVSQDVIFGDAIVVDQAVGQAYSFGAISIQAGKGSNNGNKRYGFNDREYAKFPSALATNFLAPRSIVQQGFVEAELILFTLDLGAGLLPVPRVAIGGITYNDDEQWCDWDYEFDCFDIVALDDVSDCHNWYPPPSNLGLGSISGHLEMYSQSILTAAGDSHDVVYGNGDGSRNRGFHGWIAQNVSTALLPGGEPIPGAPPVFVVNTAAWGRPLAQSTTDLVPDSGDWDPVLDLDPTGP